MPFYLASAVDACKDVSIKWQKMGTALDEIFAPFSLIPRQNLRHGRLSSHREIKAPVFFLPMNAGEKYAHTAKKHL